MDEDGATIEDEDQHAPGPHKQHISQRRNDRVLPQPRGGRPHRSGARPTARPQQQQQHQPPQHQQQTAARQQHHKQQRSKQQRSSSITNSPDPSIIISDAAEPTAAGSRGANCVVMAEPVTRRPPRRTSTRDRGYRSTQRGAPATRRRLSVTRRPFRGLCHATRGYRSAQRHIYLEHSNLEV